MLVLFNILVKIPIRSAQLLLRALLLVGIYELWWGLVYHILFKTCLAFRNYLNSIRLAFIGTAKWGDSEALWTSSLN